MCFIFTVFTPGAVAAQLKQSSKLHAYTQTK